MSDIYFKPNSDSQRPEPKGGYPLRTAPLLWLPADRCPAAGNGNGPYGNLPMSDSSPAIKSSRAGRRCGRRGGGVTSDELQTYTVYTS